MSRSRTLRLITALAFAGVVGGAARSDAASVSISWNAPTTNADGTPLTDLAAYRIYMGTATPACPSASFHTVSSATSTPPSAQTVNSLITGLAAGTTYVVRITAVDAVGNESTCSPSASGVAQADFSVSPTTTTSFGSIIAGTTVDRTFSVQNTSGTGITGGVTVGAPYSVVSGGSFSLAPGASQTVTVRFAPTASGTFAANLNFTASGDTLARPITGSATGAPVTLTIAKSGTGGGTVTSAPAGIACSSDCSETVTPGTSFTLTATPAAGSTFAGWSGACSGTGTCAVTVNAATSVTARFDLAPVGLAVSRSGNGSGSVTSSPAGIACGSDCTETVAPGTSFTLTATPAAGSTFAGWSGACSGTGACAVTVNAATSVTAAFTLAPVSLTVNKTGSGAGTITSAPAGIACGSDCTETVTPGTSFTLTATPAAGSTFAGWSGACSGTGACAVTVNTATLVTATFNPAPVGLAVTRNGSGSGNVTSSPAGIACGSDCTETVTPGTSFTLTATPATGSTFAGWSGGGCTGTGPCAVTVNAATTVTATFTLAPVTLTVSKTGSGAGTITSTPAGIACGADCSETVTPGTQLTLTASPAGGSTFTGWSGACSGTGSCVVTVNAATTVTATFQAPTPTVQLSVATTGTGAGTVSGSMAGIACGTSCQAMVPTGTPVTLTAAAASGSSFTGWSGACSGTALTCSWTMNSAATVTATFDSTARQQPAPAPVARDASPSNVTAGSPDFTLTVQGRGFVASSVVHWNGSPRTTRFVSSRELRAAIVAADVATAQSVSVNVVTPAPGGGISSPVKFVVAAPPTPPAPGTPPTTPTLPVGGELIVDNAGPGVQDAAGGRTFTGRWCPALTMSKYGASSLYACGSGIDSYRWTPQIPVSGIYDVYVWVTGSMFLSRNVPFVVAHQDGTTSQTIDQRTGSGHWVLHGRYFFSAGAAGYVETTFDQANGTRGTAGADAIRFIRRK